MKFIKLTRVGDFPEWVNFSLVQTIRLMTREDTTHVTRLFFIGEYQSLDFLETPEEIMELLK